MTASGRGKKKSSPKKPAWRKVPKAAAAGAPIRHVVLQMFENRSFDQMLGLLQKDMPGLVCVPPGAATRFNDDAQGSRYFQTAGAVRMVDPDPPHGHPAVIDALRNGGARLVKSYGMSTGHCEDGRVSLPEPGAHMQEHFAPTVSAEPSELEDAICDAGVRKHRLPGATSKPELPYPDSPF